MSIRKLNIIMTYPVTWTMYMVLRDYIQNFFDASGPEDFEDKFKYSYDAEKKTLTMSSGIPFEKEWLLFMGTSTKRGESGRYAGKFGEGFKIASLVAYRDYHLSITMESMDWRLKVTESDQTIDSTPVKCLAYDITKRKNSGKTTLSLKGLSQNDYEEIDFIMEGFYYKGNPAFGKEIFCNENYALYEKNPEKGKMGYIYACFQRRKYIDYPFIFCDNRFESRRDDRDREDLTDKESLLCMLDVIAQLTPAEALFVLEKIERYWDGRTRGRYTISPKSIVSQLISKICTDGKLKNLFCKKYNGRILAGCSEYLSGNRKRMAFAWFRNSDYHSSLRIVLHRFIDLGITDIEKLCEKENGFEVIKNPDRYEAGFISVLKEATEDSFSDIYQYKSIPECKVITNESAPVEGQARMLRTSKARKNSFGLVVKNDVNYILLTRKILHTGTFGEALSVYLHELLHQYGGDNSLQFHRALIIINRRIIEKGEAFNPYILKWEDLHREAAENSV